MRGLHYQLLWMKSGDCTQMSPRWILSAIAILRQLTDGSILAIPDRPSDEL